MRTVTLHARSFAFGEATLAASFGVVVFIALLPGFARLWELMVNEEWLAPLVTMSLVQFIAATLVAHRCGKMTRETLWTELLIKALIALAYVTGFVLQRMWDGADTDSMWASVGHAVSGSLITIELLRFVAVIRSAGLRIPLLEILAQVLEKTVVGAVRTQAQRERTEQATAKGVITGAKAGWQAAREDYFDKGTVGPPPKTEQISDILPVVLPKVEDSDPDMDAMDGETGKGACTDGSGPIPPPPPTAGQR
jgi:hypothetical protein